MATKTPMPEVEQRLWMATKTRVSETLQPLVLQNYLPDSPRQSTSSGYRKQKLMIDMLAKASVAPPLGRLQKECCVWLGGSEIQSPHSGRLRKRKSMIGGSLQQHTGWHGYGPAFGRLRKFAWATKRPLIQLGSGSVTLGWLRKSCVAGGFKVTFFG